MSLEAIAYLLAAIPVVHRWLKTQAMQAETAAHAIAQNTEILGRQTAILEALAPLVHDLSDRVAALEGEEEELEPAIGFRVEEDEEDGDEEGEEPANVRPRKRR